MDGGDPLKCSSVSTGLVECQCAESDNNCFRSDIGIGGTRGKLNVKMAVNRSRFIYCRRRLSILLIDALFLLSPFLFDLPLDG